MRRASYEVAYWLYLFAMFAFGVWILNRIQAAKGRLPWLVGIIVFGTIFGLADYFIEKWRCAPTRICSDVRPKYTVNGTPVQPMICVKQNAHAGPHVYMDYGEFLRTKNN